MGLLSFIFGFCTGFYTRSTNFGCQLNSTIFAAYKMLQHENISHYKLVLVVRDDLCMGRGKIAAQCSHASVLAYRAAMLSHQEIATIWEACGQTKVVLKTTSVLDLSDLQDEAESLGLLTNIVRDAGRTEVTPGTETVLAIGPGPANVIDEVTRHLKLL